MIQSRADVNSTADRNRLAGANDPIPPPRQSVDALVAYPRMMPVPGSLSPASALAALSVLLAAAPGAQAAEPGWAPEVHALYTLRYNGLDVGALDITSKTGAHSYTVSGSGKVSVIFGLVTWAGSSSVTGAIENGAPAPKTYAFDWKKNSKGGTIRLGYTGHKATTIAVDPPSGDHPDTVPLRPEHSAGALDPLTAVMMLTRADGRPPCERTAEIFDGKQRYNLVFSLKRHARIPAAQAGGPSTIGVVCRAMYEPIAGHRDNDANRTYASNREVEIVMRPIPGTKFMIPYSVAIPTAWGTGSMTTAHISITTPQGTQVALTE